MIDQSVLQSCDDAAPAAGTISDGDYPADEQRGEFRAGLLYIAADLRSLATRAPAGRAAEVMALSHLVARLATH